MKIAIQELFLTRSGTEGGKKREVETSSVFSWMREIAKIAGGRVYLCYEL